MIKFTDSNGTFQNNNEMSFDSNPNYQSIILNGIPDFRDTQKNDFIIGQNSSGINKAATSLFSLDILGIDRTLTPDIGAYQHIIFK
mgnify:CR=1 FL=1